MDRLRIIRRGQQKHFVGRSFFSQPFLKQVLNEMTQQTGMPATFEHHAIAIARRVDRTSLGCFLSPQPHSRIDSGISHTVSRSGFCRHLILCDTLENTYEGRKGRGKAMQGQRGHYQYTPTDLIEFFRSPFASWMSRFHHDFPGHLQPDADAPELVSLASAAHAMSSRSWNDSTPTLTMSGRFPRPLTVSHLRGRRCEPAMPLSIMAHPDNVREKRLCAGRRRYAHPPPQY